MNVILPIPVLFTAEYAFLGPLAPRSTPSSRRPWGWRGLDKARCDTIDKACEFAGIKTSVALGRGKNAKPKRMSVLDVGCGVGGSSR
jgi:hypothetical protein